MNENENRKEMVMVMVKSDVISTPITPSSPNQSSMDRSDSSTYFNSRIWCIVSKRSPSALMAEVVVQLPASTPDMNVNVSGKSCTGLSFQYSSSQFDHIHSKTDWEKHLLVLFDVALPDIFHNLEDAMIRFRKNKRVSIIDGSLIEYLFIIIILI